MKVNKTALLSVVIAAMIALAAVATGCNEAPAEGQPIAKAPAVQAVPAANPAAAPADAGSAPDGCGGDCTGCEEGAKADTGCADCESKGQDCSGDCGDCEAYAAGECAGDCADCEDGAKADCCGECGGDAKSAPAATAADDEAPAETACAGAAESDCGGTCSTCPGKAKALAEMATLAKVLLPVEGMTCETCENAIKNSLSKINGIETSVPSHAEGTTWVAYTPSKVDLKAIAAGIERLGYTVGDPLENVEPLPALAKGHERAAIYVDKMGCGDCSPRIHEAIGMIDGVDCCSLDRTFNMLLVDYDPAVTEPAQFKNAVLNLGYAAGLPGEDMAVPEKLHCAGCAEGDKV